MKKTIHVVGAIIQNSDKEILCALRSTKMSLPNLWEFPGGKLEPNENIKAAIEREIREELLCDVLYEEIFHENTHEYETFVIKLTTVRCSLVAGTPVNTEHAKLLWLPVENLTSLNWAPADIPAVNTLISKNL